jgi:hypothetical protein
MPIPHLFQDPSLSNLKKNTERLDAIHARDPEAFDAHVRHFLAGVDSVLLRMGGGVRDSINMERWALTPNNLRWSEILAGGPSWRSMGDTTLRAANENFFAQIKQIHYVRALLQNPGRISELAAKYNVSITKAEQELSHFIGSRVASVEVALHRAVVLQITPAQMIEDCIPDKFSKDSVTALFFESFTGEDSLARLLFVPSN